MNRNWFKCTHGGHPVYVNLDRVDSVVFWSDEVRLCYGRSEDDYTPVKDPVEIQVLRDLLDLRLADPSQA